MSEPTPEQIKAQSEKFHAFEWLRSQAGNKHAQVLMEELQYLNEYRDTSRAMREDLIQKIINYTDNSADAMEGADMDEFVRAETRMGAGIDFLKLMGIKYDPITGKRESL